MVGYRRREGGRISAFMSACLLLATLAVACAGGTRAGPASGGSPSGELRVAGLNSDRTALEGVVTAFESRHPGANVTLTLADVDQYQAALRTQLTSGTAPDVMVVWPGNGNAMAMEVLVPDKLIADLSDRSWVGQIPSGLRNVTQVDGATYIVPSTFTGIGAIYNQTALEAAGLSAPTTWSGVLGLCDAAKTKGKVAFSLGNQTDWNTQLIDYALVATTVYAADPTFDREMAAGARTFVGSGWETAMEKYLEMEARGCFEKDPLGVPMESTLTAVARGDAFAVVNGVWALNDIRKQAPEGTTFVMHPLPATDNPAETRMAGAAGVGFGVNSKTKSRDLATAFIDMMATPDVQNSYATLAGALPAIPNAAFQIDPAITDLRDYQIAGKTVPFMDQLWPNPRVQQAHFAAVQNLFAGKATVPQALVKMDEAYRLGSGN